MSFAPLLGIQMAPLLMTLVRKGKVSTGTYHRVYAMSLSLGYAVSSAKMLAGAAGLEGGVDPIKACIMFSFPLARCRKMGMSAKQFWTGMLLVGTIVYPLLLKDRLHDMLSDWFKLWLVRVVCAVTFGRQMWTYSTLFVEVEEEWLDSINRTRKRLASGTKEVASAEPL